MKKALFLDRDGVINVEKNYVYRVEDFEFMDGIFKVLKAFQGKGYLIIVITNQAGIARGYYTEEDFNKLNYWMLNEFKHNGIVIDKVYYDPYHPLYGVGVYKKDSFNRKPNPGMILEAQREFDIDLPNSIIVGDKASDLYAGRNAGINNLVLVKGLVNSEILGLEYQTINSISELIKLI